MEKVTPIGTECIHVQFHGSSLSVGRSNDDLSHVESFILAETDLIHSIHNKRLGDFLLLRHALSNENR